MGFIGSSINTSPTVALPSAAVLTGAAMKCVKLSTTTPGSFELCNAAGEMAYGFLVAETPDTLAVGDNATVQITAIGKAIAGSAIAVGDPLTPDATGNVTKAATGNYIVGYAVTAASGSGKVFDIQIQKGGKF